jgi:predicted ATPase with chaperone activity
MLTPYSYRRKQGARSGADGISYNGGQPRACPCGYYGDPIRPCTCAPSAVTKCQKRISGPLLDQIDIHVEVRRVDYQKLSDDRLGEPSSIVRARVEAARERQRQRFLPIPGSNIVCNADMHVAEIRRFCKLDAAGESLVRTWRGARPSRRHICTNRSNCLSVFSLRVLCVEHLSFQS